MKWLAAAFDGAQDRFTIADTAEQAEAAYITQFGRPEFGIWTFQNRDEYREALSGVSEVMGFQKEQSIPVYMTGKWICVTPISEAGVARAQADGSVDRLLNDWSAADGSFKVDADKSSTAPTKTPDGWQVFAPHLKDASDRIKQRLDTVNGLVQLAWDIDNGKEPPLSQSEFASIEAAYDALKVAPMLRSIKAHHSTQS